LSSIELLNLPTNEDKVFISGQDQYQGKNKDCTPTSEQGRRQGQYQGQNKGFTLTSER
jgi:hypothetical protein